MITREQQLAFSRLSERAAAGDPEAVFLAELFSSPDQLVVQPGATGP